MIINDSDIQAAEERAKDSERKEAATLALGLVFGLCGWLSIGLLLADMFNELAKFGG